MKKNFKKRNFFSKTPLKNEKKCIIIGQINDTGGFFGD
jgi:hypothetical protein